MIALGNSCILYFPQVYFLSGHYWKKRNVLAKHFLVLDQKYPCIVVFLNWSQSLICPMKL